MFSLYDSGARGQLLFYCFAVVFCVLWLAGSHSDDGTAFSPKQ